MNSDSQVQVARIVGDVAAASIAGAVWVQWIPPIAGSLTIIWVCIQIADYLFIKRRFPQRIMKWLKEK